MNIDGIPVWQNATGDSGHNYASICLEYNVILSGWGGKHYDLLDDEDAKTWCRVFCKEMKKGDIVVLKRGVTELWGIGLIGEYRWCGEFDDIDGWVVGHVRTVRWVYQAANSEEARSHFNGRRVFTMATTTRLWQEDVLSFVKEKLKDFDDQEYVIDESKLDSLVSKSGDRGEKLDLTAEDIADYLFEQGLPNDSIRDLLDPHGSFVQIAKWYWRAREAGDTSEHETVCHLVVPLLKVLGWTPQKMAIEWGRIDIALFDRLPRNDNQSQNLSVVVEVKSIGNPCLGALGQAIDYADQYENCTRIILSDGQRFAIYVRGEDRKDGKHGWLEDQNPYAYFNILRPRLLYPLFKGDDGKDLKGAKEALYAMTPNWMPTKKDSN